jgi:hypothetical protein
MSMEHGPLGPEYCRLCDEALKAGQQALELCERCKRAGIPVEEAEAAARELVQGAAARKREFFPLNT